MTQPIQKKHIITIAGNPGSGKSTASKRLAAELGYEHFSSGDLFRAIGKERGVDVGQTNLLAEKQKDIDEMVDQRLQEIGATQDRVVIDSRLAWHWIADSFKVFLDLDIEVAAQRILQEMDPLRLMHEHIPNDPDEYAKMLQERKNIEIRRYKTLYQVNPFDVANFDLVVDTQANTSSQTMKKILESYERWLES